MLPKLALHLQPEHGWINDPNGLCYFQGKYHAFFQHNPKAPVWDTMHWGHAVSEDLLHWEELPIALYPDQPYESGQGCFSGSAVEKDGRLYLFYTAVDSRLAQTQCLAWTDDGQHFTKYPGNPILPQSPIDPASRTSGTPRCSPGRTALTAWSAAWARRDTPRWCCTALRICSTGTMWAPCLKPGRWALCWSAPTCSPWRTSGCFASPAWMSPAVCSLSLAALTGSVLSPKTSSGRRWGPTSTRPKALWTTRAGGFSWAGWPLGSAPWTRMRCAAGCLTVPPGALLRRRRAAVPVPRGGGPALPHPGGRPHPARGVAVPGDRRGENPAGAPASAIWDVRVLSDTHTCEVFLNGGEQVCSFYFQP